MMPTAKETATDVAIQDDLIAPAVEYIYTNYRSPIRNTTLAAMCHLSESQLRRRFLATYALTPHAYTNRLRCRIAAQMLLDSTCSIEEVAEAVGFNATSDLFRNFKSNFSQSPTAWRKSHRKLQNT